MANNPILYPINTAQVNEALTTYASNSTITTGLNALKTALTDTTALPYKCNFCSGSGIDNAKTYKNAQTGNTVQLVCPACGGNGRLKQPVKLKITKQIVGK